jgi:hypothetical protein
MRQACRKMVAPFSSVWSLSTMPSRRPPRSLASRFLRSPSGWARKVFAVELQQVEAVEHGLAYGAAAVQSIEDCDAVRTAYHGLAI